METEREAVLESGQSIFSIASTLHAMMEEQERCEELGSVAMACFNIHFLTDLALGGHDEDCPCDHLEDQDCENNQDMVRAYILYLDAALFCGWKFPSLQSCRDFSIGNPDRYAKALFPDGYDQDADFVAWCREENKKTPLGLTTTCKITLNERYDRHKVHEQMVADWKDPVKRAAMEKEFDEECELDRKRRKFLD